MRAYLIGFAILVLCVCLEDAWPSWLRLAGQVPALAVAFVACVGLVRGPVDGCAAGLAAAVLLAGAQHVPLGGLCLAMMILGTGAGLLRGTLFAERLLVAVLTTAVGVILTSLIRMVFVPPQQFVVWLGDTVARAAFAALLTPPVFWAARWLRPAERVR